MMETRKKKPGWYRASVCLTRVIFVYSVGQTVLARAGEDWLSYLTYLASAMAAFAWGFTLIDWEH